MKQEDETVDFMNDMVVSGAFADIANDFLGGQVVDGGISCDDYVIELKFKQRLAGTNGYTVVRSKRGWQLEAGDRLGFLSGLINTAKARDIVKCCGWKYFHAASTFSPSLNLTP